MDICIDMLMAVAVYREPPFALYSQPPRYAGGVMASSASFAAKVARVRGRQLPRNSGFVLAERYCLSALRMVRY